MTVPIIKHAFTAGEIAPAYYGRTDLDKYDLGVAEARNFFVDYRGGLSSRPGTRFCGTIPEHSRLFVFRTAFESTPNFLVCVAPGELLLFQEGQELATQLQVPYGAAALPSLKAWQILNKLYFTHPEYPVHFLEFDGIDWTFAPEEFKPRIDPPTVFTLQPEITDDDNNHAHVAFAVTAVDAEGNESHASRLQVLTDISNYTQVAGSVRLTWAAVPGAASYRVYRTNIALKAAISQSSELGFIGSTVAPIFVDSNIVPDFTRQPPLHVNPFANGAITRIELPSRGSGYTQAATIDFLTGEGFVGNPVVAPDLATQYPSGALLGFTILNGGEGYILNQLAFIADPNGDGAIARVAEVTASSGNYPSCGCRFQQRFVFAGSFNEPLTVWGSRPGLTPNFDVSTFLTAGDAYNFTLDSQDFSPIKHLVPIRDSLLIFHAGGVDRLSAEEGRAVSAISAVVENQASLGIGEAEPVLINNDIIYVQSRGSAVQALAYTFYTNSYTAQDISILSNHLMEPAPIIRMAWNEEPHKVLWAVRADGKLLSLTYLREQEVFGWCRHETEGLFRDVALVQELDRDVVYFAVERDGVWMLEALEPRRIDEEKRAWCVDSGLQYEGPEVTEVSGLEHLEGKTVAIFADGDVEEQKIVVNGTVELEYPRSLVTVGLPYTARFVSLPLTDRENQLDGREKRIASVEMRLRQTRGIFVGTLGHTLYEVKEPLPEAYDTLRPLIDGMVTQHVDAAWDFDQQLVVEQRYPLPVTLLGFVLKVAI